MIFGDAWDVPNGFFVVFFCFLLGFCWFFVCFFGFCWFCLFFVCFMFVFCWFFWFLLVLFVFCLFYVCFLFVFLVFVGFVCFCWFCFFWEGGLFALGNRKKRTLLDFVGLFLGCTAGVSRGLGDFKDEMYSSLWRDRMSTEF